MFDFNLLTPTQYFRAVLPATLRALFVTAIKLAEKTPSPAGEGWGEGNTKQENTLKSPSSQPSPVGEGAKLLNLMAVTLSSRTGSFFAASKA